MADFGRLLSEVKVSSHEYTCPVSLILYASLAVTSGELS